MLVNEKELEKLRDNVFEKIDSEDAELVNEYITKLTHLLEQQVNEEFAEYKEGITLEFERRLKTIRAETRDSLERGLLRKAYQRGRVTGFQYASVCVMVVIFVTYVVTQ